MYTIKITFYSFELEEKTDLIPESINIIFIIL